MALDERNEGRRERLLLALAKYQEKDPATLTDRQKEAMAGYEAALKRLNAGLPEVPETGNPVGADIRL